jgi:hypothetical protein
LDNNETTLEKAYNLSNELLENKDEFNDKV